VDLTGVLFCRSKSANEHHASPPLALILLFTAPYMLLLETTRDKGVAGNTVKKGTKTRSRHAKKLHSQPRSSAAGRAKIVEASPSVEGIFRPSMAGRCCHV
jgi:hypothetical protein